jgi:Leucine-rich repeat (LRR) protein
MYRTPQSPPSRLYENLAKPVTQPLSHTASHYQRRLEFSRSANSAHFYARNYTTANPAVFQHIPPQPESSSEWAVLDISGLAVRNVSAALFAYTNLTALFLNHNNLTYIPHAISALTSLVVLDLSANAITFLPPHLGLLFRLKELLLFDNHISTLPHELGFLFQLEVLGLDGNPIPEPIPSLLIKEGTSGVVTYLRDSCPGASLSLLFLLIAFYSINSNGISRSAAA